MEKALKLIWLIIGCVILLTIPIFIYVTIRGELLSNYPSDSFDQSLVVGAEQRQAIKKGKVLQGIVYDRILEIEGTTDHVLPLSARKFKNLKEAEKFYQEFEEAVSSAGDMSFGAALGYVNLLFLDSNYTIINTLLNHKAYISSYTLPNYYRTNEKEEAPIKNILYNISFEDSNKDGLLNENDFQDLYISDLRGENLKQVTKGLMVLDSRFINHNSEILIEYQLLGQGQNEYRRKSFAKYNIEKNSLVELRGITKKILELEEKIMVDTLDNQQ
jgi:hypothetical protein